MSDDSTQRGRRGFLKSLVAGMALIGASAGSANAEKKVAFCRYGPAVDLRKR